MVFFSCNKDKIIENNGNKADVNSESSLSNKAASIDLPGRTLAANCFQCHGTNGHAGELKIAGQSASGIIKELNEMKTRNPRANIMSVHSVAYTSEEIKLIADYISKQ